MFELLTAFTPPGHPGSLVFCSQLFDTQNTKSRIGAQHFFLEKKMNPVLVGILPIMALAGAKELALAGAKAD